MDILNSLFNQSKQGYALQDTDGYLRMIIGNPLNSQLFRGQNKHYPLIPSFQRPQLFSDNIGHCVKYIKREEFKATFKVTPYFEYFSQLESLGSRFKFDLDAIAQHYGFATNYLDITTDEQIAKFFAYTYYNRETKQYHPITDFTNYQPTLYTSLTLCFENLHPLVIVGFQAVLRPQQQKAMAIDTSDNICASVFFSQIHLESNPKIAQEIYEKFNGGKDLFPENEPIGKIQREVEQRKVLNQELFLEYCDKFVKDKEKLEIQLANKGYTIEQFSFSIDKKTTMEMRDDIDKIIIWINKNIAFYKMAFA